jgi:hypothetical protein
VSAATTAVKRVVQAIAKLWKRPPSNQINSIAKEYFAAAKRLLPVL